MTIAERNKVRVTAITIMSLISLFALAAVISLFIKGNVTATAEAGLAATAGLKSAPHSRAAICFSLLAFPFFSAGLLIYIYISFKKTHAIEISFFVIYLFSAGLESLRLIFPIYNTSNMVSENIAYISRLIYVARLTGVMSLFMSSIFAVKVMTRQISYIIFFTFFVAFSLVFSMPVNNFYSDRYFFSGAGYYYPYTSVSMITALLACITYFFAYISKKAKEYLIAAAALLFSTAGYWMLIYTQSYPLLAAGSIVFVTATVFFVKNIHSYHIWQ